MRHNLNLIGPGLLCSYPTSTSFSRIFIYAPRLFQCLILLTLSFYVHGQTGANSFPASGNASVGTPGSPNSFTVNGTIITNGRITQTGGFPNSTTGFSTYLVTNSQLASSTTALNPGLLVYGDGGYAYGMDLGYNPTVNHYRTRIFCPSTADLSLSAVIDPTSGPTQQGQFTDGLVMLGNTGNILIGKASQTNSSYKLDVAGSVRADKITVNSNGADFVFDSAYRLPALSDLDAFIQANHHLPLMPSAVDMVNNGMDLGDSQTRLLQKTEELTLYAIEADRQIHQLKDLNAKQSAVLEDQQKTLKAQQELLLKLQARLDELTYKATPKSE